MDCRVLLLGGVGDGLAVNLQRLVTEIQVLLQDGVPVITESKHGNDTGVVAETYRLVGPVGPEMPVYVRA